MSRARSRDVEKERQWREVIREAAGSGLSIREFCRERGVKESQFYRWQRRLKGGRRERMLGRRSGSKERRSDGQSVRDSGSFTRFALVSEEGSVLDAGLELVLGDGRRLRIGKGVDEETLRRVLAVLESPGC